MPVAAALISHASTVDAWRPGSSAERVEFDMLAATVTAAAAAAAEALASSPFDI